MARQGTYASTFVWQGKRIYVYGNSPAEAKENAIKRKTLLEHGVVENRSSTTVKEWAKKWLKDYKKNAIGDAWYKQTEGIVNNHILPSLGSKPLRCVTAADIRRLMNSKAQFSESHQRKIAQIILQIFGSAVENDIIDKLPMMKIKIATRASEGSSRTVTEEERSLTLAVAEKNPELGMQFLLMLFCGLRPQEVARLKMSDYDKAKQIITVRRARKADGSTDAPKSKKGTREIPVPTYLAERLNSLGKKPNEYVCTSVQGKPLTKSSQKRSWHKFRRLMDIENGAEVFRNHVVQTTLAEDLHPYDYRHTYCTDLQDAGVPITVAQRLMGHSDIKTTAQIYTHHSPKSFEDARDKIEELTNKIIG